MSHLMVNIPNLGACKCLAAHMTISFEMVFKILFVLEISFRRFAKAATPTAFNNFHIWLQMDTHVLLERVIPTIDCQSPVPILQFSSSIYFLNSYFHSDPESDRISARRVIRQIVFSKGNLWICMKMFHSMAYPYYLHIQILRSLTKTIDNFFFPKFPFLP